MNHYVCTLHYSYLFCLVVLGELIGDMETSNTDPLDTTKDTSNLGDKKISEEIGNASYKNPAT